MNNYDPAGDDCREGYVCTPLDEADAPGVCVPGCASDDDCPAGLACDLETGLCEGEDVPEPQPDGPVGAPCVDDSHCALLLTCLPQEADGNPPGGYCTADCWLWLDLCPGGSYCIETAGGANACVAGCIGDDDCRPGYSCTDTADGRTACLQE